MLRVFTATRRMTARAPVAGFVASFAMAIALAGGVAATATAFTPDVAEAQNSRRNASPQPPRNSDGFAAAYQPIFAMVQPGTANFEGARAAIPTVIAAIENEADRNIAGNLILSIGSGLNDRSLQRQGLQMMVDSGMVEAERLGQFHWFIGSLAFQLEDWAGARTGFENAIGVGFVPDDDVVALIADTYEREENPRGAYDYVMGAVRQAEAAGSPVSEDWLLSALQNTYDYEMAPEALNVAEVLIRNHPTQRNWENSLRMLGQLNDTLPDAAMVDLYRLMRLNDALVDRSEFTAYIEALDPRLMSNEVLVVLAAGVEKDVFQTTGDPYYTEVKGIADVRAPADRSGIGRIVSDGESGDGLDAMSAGDVLYSLSDFARAEGMYQTALGRGYDANAANVRIGIARTQQGNHAGALESFGQVSGEREPIARMWLAYVRQLMAG